MIIDDYYNYITLMAFITLYKYEGKRSLSVDKLKEIRKALLEEVLDNYKNGKRKYYRELDQWQGEVSFKNINQEEALMAFLEEYEDCFYLENDIVYLRDEISYEDISELARQLRVKEQIPSRIDIMEDSKKLRELLEINTIPNLLNKYSKIEESLEQLYYKLYTPEDSLELRRQIKSLLFLRFNFFNQVSKMPDYRVDAFRLVTTFDLDHVEYDKYPIDLKLWNEEFTDPEEVNDILSDIDDRVYDITQYAIFGKKVNPLYLVKINEDLERYYITDRYLGCNGEEEIDPMKDYTDMIETDMIAQERFEEEYENNPDIFRTLHDPSDEFWVLYINYLNNLNHFMSIYGETENLLLAKKRLLYALDKPATMLYEEDNFKKELENTKSIELDEDPFDFFAEEFCFMAQEVFMVPVDEYTIRKLLLVGTYYDLTQDEFIKECIEVYKEHPNYEFFYEIMINNCNRKEPLSLPNDIKKRILKPTNNK